MNERIRELEDQCWVQVPCDFDMRKGGLSTINTVFDRKKFAALIVRECENVELYWLSRADRTAVFEKIRQHFGVSE